MPEWYENWKNAVLLSDGSEPEIVFAVFMPSDNEDRYVVKLLDVEAYKFIDYEFDDSEIRGVVDSMQTWLDRKKLKK
jgi:hypothetical protein